jgi:hypothetical protein
MNGEAKVLAISTRLRFNRNRGKQGRYTLPASHLIASVDRRNIDKAAASVAVQAAPVHH